MMTPTELRLTLERLGLTSGRAARLLAVNPRTVRSWLDDGRHSRPIPDLVPRVLHLIEHVPGVWEVLSQDY